MNSSGLFPSLDELAADLLFICYRNRRDNGESEMELAASDDFQGAAVVLEIRYQVALAAELAAAREIEQRCEEAERDALDDLWRLAYQMAPRGE